MSPANSSSFSFLFNKWLSIQHPLLEKQVIQSTLFAAQGSDIQ
jgi:hypothetical protein